MGPIRCGRCMGVAAAHQVIPIIIIIITRFSCLEARCVCRQAAVKAEKNLPLVGLTRSKQDPINRGHGAQNSCRAPPAGANNTSSDTQ